MDQWEYLGDRIRNENIRKNFGVANIKKKMKKNHLNDLGMCKDAYQLTVKKDRKLVQRDLKYRMKKTKDDLKLVDLDLQIEMVENWNEWKRRIHVEQHQI